MAPKSNIDKLDKKTKEEIITLLQDSTVRYIDIVNIINKKLGTKAISSSGLSRYKKRFDNLLDKKKEIESIASAWRDKTGDELGNILGKQTMEEIRMLVYDFVGSLQEIQNSEVANMDIKEIERMSNAIEKSTRGIINLENAIAKNNQHTEEIRNKALQEVQAKALNNANSAGISQDTVNTIFRDVFNINN
ncbi:putative Mu-like prophage FluMu protein GP27 [Brachyspira pilosicoli WesB]|uniref:Putative Mu-like prophage FluMu protein GP27 n=1 Tax=Brachyspira pilosicoli WesB TaxID=1161918 RepID=K0JGA1_BRAPL|nr:phage protein Gp27 family protein [Brachyspira pilosicoli]CCG55772.1 putative Mu-like prophage FluMu protein GP27 [Brachyspira pilosicoli WesB]